jgi:hypothetical protein
MTLCGQQFSPWGLYNTCNIIEAPGLQTLCFLVEREYHFKLQSELQFSHDIPQPSPIQARHFPVLTRMSFEFEDPVKKIWNLSDFERLFVHYVNRCIVSFPDGVEVVMGRRPLAKS